MTKTILIVDDVEMNRELLKLILEDQYRIFEASDGLEAWEILKTRGPGIDLILLDIRMPVMDGFGFLEKMEECGYKEKIPVIFISAETTEENVQKGIQWGVRDIIAKPFDQHLIHNRVDNLIQLYQYKKSQPKPRKKIVCNKALIVDDIEINRMLLTEILQDDFEVMEAKDGVEAIELVKRYRRELAIILMDIVMPEMDGLQAVYKLKKIGMLDRIPVIFVTGHNSIANAVRVKELGIHDMIVKPYDPEVIKSRIHNLVELNQRIQDH